mgnify:CR=1 FL=1
MAPPPHTPTFEDITPELALLFRRAFERGSERDGCRPKPSEWITALQRLKTSLITCQVNPQHKYWHGARSCIWCRLARNNGPDYYQVHCIYQHTVSFVVNEEKLREVLRQLEIFRLWNPPSDYQRFIVKSSPVPKPLPRDLEDYSNTTRVLSIALALCLLALPLGLLHKAFFLTGLIGALIFGCWLFVCLSLSPAHQEYRRRLKAFKQARLALQRLEYKWKATISNYQTIHDQLYHSIQNLIAQCRELTTQYQNELRSLTKKAEDEARQHYLRLHLVADAHIPLIGQRRAQILATHGVITAADIDPQRILCISGFGQVMTQHLLNWKEEVLRNFRFDPKTALSFKEHKMLVDKFNNLQQQILKQIEERIHKLETLPSVCRADLDNRILNLRNAIDLLAQAEADLHLMKTKLR